MAGRKSIDKIRNAENLDLALAGFSENQRRYDDMKSHDTDIFALRKAIEELKRYQAAISKYSGGQILPALEDYLANFTARVAGIPVIGPYDEDDTKQAHAGTLARTERTAAKVEAKRAMLPSFSPMVSEISEAARDASYARSAARSMALSEERARKASAASHLSNLKESIDVFLGQRLRIQNCNEAEGIQKVYAAIQSLEKADALIKHHYNLFLEAVGSGFKREGVGEYHPVIEAEREMRFIAEQLKRLNGIYGAIAKERAGAAVLPLSPMAVESAAGSREPYADMSPPKNPSLQVFWKELRRSGLPLADQEATMLLAEKIARELPRSPGRF